MNCPQCHETLSDSARFCSNCGIPFVSYHTPTEAFVPPAIEETHLPLDPMIGRILDGKYELIHRLGEGGMGTVYRGRRIHIGDEVAVKVLLQKYLSVPSAVERFRREARAAAMLRHPNVVSIYDFAEAGFSGAVPAYIVMELVQGESLRELLKREVKLELRRACSIMRDICAGVGAGHKREVIHRDLKPDNVIVVAPDEDDEREMIKVVDFGIAKLRDLVEGPTLTLTGIAMGTPFYMSPEQCRGDALDTRSDVYSLGAMLYEMLAGTPPFMARTATGVVAKHLTEPPPPLPENLGVPKTVDAVITRALSKNADARQPDALAFSRELQAALSQSRPEPPTPELATSVGKATLASLPRFQDEVISAPLQPFVAGGTVRRSVQEGGRDTAPEVVAASTHPLRSYDQVDAGRFTDETAVRGQRKLWLVVALIGLLTAVATLAVFLSWRSDTNVSTLAKTGSSQPGSNGSSSGALTTSMLRTLTAEHELFEVAMSPDAQTLVSTGDENRLRLWSIGDGRLIRELSGYERRGRCVAISPNGGIIASGNDDGSVRLWNLSDGRLLKTLQGHTNYVFIVGFSPDGQKLVSASADKTLRLWRVYDGTQIGTITVTEPTDLIITVSPAQLILALLGADKGVKLWSIEQNALLRKLEGHHFDVTSGAFSPDGKALALGSSDGMVRLWDVTSGKLLRTFEGVKGQEAGSIAFNPVGDILAVGSGDGSIKLWRAADGQLLGNMEGHQKGVHSLSFSADGQVLASGSDDKTIRLWQIASK